MKTLYFLISIFLIAAQASAQQVATFENINLDAASWWNGSDGSGGIESGEIWFPNSYNADWGSWSGFSVSNMTDTLTPGYQNQYSTIAGSGAEASDNYAVVYISGEQLLEFDQSMEVSGFYAANTTYTYLSMKNGDDFTKKFGGTEGTDPDYLKLIITGLDADNNAVDSVIFHLADFTSDDPEADYIVKDWQWVDLSTLGSVSALTFKMQSTDMGAWGMNTPAYFSMDNFTATPAGATAGETNDFRRTLHVYPNPVRDNFWVALPAGIDKLTLSDSFGKTVATKYPEGQNKVLVTVEPRAFV